MNFLAFDSLPLKDLVVHLKDNPENRGSDWIIALYGSCLIETISKNYIARNLQGNISIYSSEEESL